MARASQLVVATTSLVEGLTNTLHPAQWPHTPLQAAWLACRELGACCHFSEVQVVLQTRPGNRSQMLRCYFYHHLSHKTQYVRLAKQLQSVQLPHSDALP